MAEAIGLAASLVTLLEVTAKVTEAVRLFRNAPVEILAVANEVSELSLILSEIKDTGEQIDNTNVATLCETLHEKLHDLEAILDRLHVQQDAPLSRLLWLKERKRVRALLEELARTKADLALVLNSVTASTSSRVQTAVEAIFINQMEILSIFQKSHWNLNSRLESLLSAVSNADSKDKRLEQPEHDGFASIRLRAVRAPLGTTMKTSTSRPSRHANLRASMPSFLRQLVGFLFLRYTASPQGYQNPEKPLNHTLQLDYYFPVWLVRRAIYMMATLNMEPSFSLVVRRVLPVNSDFFELVTCNRLERILGAFEDRSSTTNDVHCMSGETALHWAIKYGRLDMCKILVRANADVGIEDMRRRTPIDVAWMEIIAGSRPRKFLEELRTLFGDKDHFELRRPQLLHRIILGFSKINLEDALPDLSLDDINARDEEGKTALCWAVLSGNLSAVQALLEAGADPNICDYAKDTPLMFGAYSRNPAILTTLVAGGAKFTANDRKDTALHKAAFRQDDPRYIRPFLDPSLGADINALSDCQETPLGLATLQNHARTVKFLAKHGANIEHVDEGDKTALFDAIKYKCHEAMQALLDCGADPTFSQQSGDTLLHNLAEWGELKALEVVKSVDLSGIDVDAQNQRGLTAMQVADLRINRPKGFTDAFGELLEWIRDSQDDYQSAVSIISSDSEYETPDIKPSKLV